MSGRRFGRTATSRIFRPRFEWACLPVSSGNGTIIEEWSGIRSSYRIDSVTRTTAVRLGIPTRVLARRILLPIGVVIILMASALSVWQIDRIQARTYQEQRSALRTVFELDQSMASGSSGLVTMARNRGYERIWVLSATGDVLNSNRRQEVGTRLEDRWWSSLRTLPSGLHQETVRFGNQNLELLSLNSVELGRQVVIVSRASGSGATWLVNSGLILLAGLILWMIVAIAVVLNLRHRIERPTHKLDDRALELIRGGHVSDVQLDRVHAEIEDALGGHADCMVDMARKLQKQGHSLMQTSSRFSVLFNALPSPAFLLDDARCVVDANEALAEAMGIDGAWLRGRDLSVMGEWIPAQRLHQWLDKTAMTPVGVRRMRFAHDFPDQTTSDGSSESGSMTDCLLTIAPMPSAAGRGHLILIEHVPSRPVETVAPDLDDVEASTSDGAPEKATEVVADSVSGKHGRPDHHATPAFSTPIDTRSLSGDGQAGLSPVIDAPEAEAEAEANAEAKVSANGEPDSSGSIESFDQSSLADIILDTVGVVAIAFNEDAETVFWSTGGKTLTGLTAEALPDLKHFTDQVFPHDKERDLFRLWLDAEPDERSQELRIRTRNGIVSSIWRAGEWYDDDHGEVGLLWTTLDPILIKQPSTAAGEPSVPSEDS